jgi:hypothetical protein
MSLHIFGETTKEITFRAPGMGTYTPDHKADIIYSAIFPTGKSRREVNKAMRGIAILLCGRSARAKIAENSFSLGTTETITVVVNTPEAIARMDRFIYTRNQSKGIVWQRTAPVKPQKKPKTGCRTAPTRS